MYFFYYDYIQTKGTCIVVNACKTRQKKKSDERLRLVAGMSYSLGYFGGENFLHIQSIQVIWTLNPPPPEHLHQI